MDLYARSTFQPFISSWASYLASLGLTSSTEYIWDTTKILFICFFCSGSSCSEKRNCLSVHILDFVRIFTNTQLLLLHFCLRSCRPEMIQEQKQRYFFEFPFMLHRWCPLSQVSEPHFTHQIGTKLWFPWKSGTSVFSKVLLLLTKRRAANTALQL